MTNGRILIVLNELLEDIAGYKQQIENFKCCGNCYYCGKCSYKKFKLCKYWESDNKTQKEREIY